MSLNIQSLTANKAELEWLIHNWEPFVVCISETRVTDNISSSEIDIEGYYTNIVYSTSRHTGGVITYVKKGYKHKIVLKETVNMNVWVLGVELSIGDKKYNILNVYHSPHSSDAIFLAKLEEIFGEFTSKTGLLLVVGDFNIDLSKDKYYSGKLKEVIERNGLYQKVDTFTRITQNSASLIDLLVTNNKDFNHRVHHTPKIADHSIVTTDIILHEKPQIFKKTCRNFTGFNELDFQLDLIDAEWLPDGTDADFMSERLIGCIKDSLDRHAPVEEKTITNYRTDKKWWTPIIGEAITVRDMMYRRAIITGNEYDWCRFREQRNSVVQMIRRQKQIYYHEKIDNVKDDSVEMWKTLRSLTKSSSRNTFKEGIVFDNMLEREKVVIAEKFNTYFLRSLNEIVIIPNQKQMNDVLGNMVKCECRLEKFRPLGFAELKTIVKSMNNKKSSVDGITPYVLKLAFDAIGNRFLQLINDILERGCFPKNWKTSTIIPLEKKSNTIKCEEYRPINMVPVYEKLLELVVNKQIVEYVETNNLLTKYQAGFRKQNSCESALQTVLSKWKNALNNKQIVGVVFIDFRRAFETINRDLLLLKLKNFGMGSVVINLLREYLEDRMQICKYNDSESTSKKSVYGVPQGTVMGPNLFVMYINDIVQYVDKCEIQLFADDTLLYIVGENVCDIVNVVNNELAALQKWLSSNSLSVNTEKTKFMLVKSRYNFIDTVNHSGVYINGKKIEQVKECKYLGVVIDDKLTFSNHATYITGKIARKVNLLSRLKNLLSNWSKLLIYKTIILPHLNYCASILFLLNNSEINNMQKRQNQALRAILKCNRYTNIKRMLEKTELLSIRQIVFLNAMTVIYKIKNGLFPRHLLDELVYVEDIHSYQTRSRGNFYVKTVTTSYSQNNLFHKGLIEFNKLPAELKSSGSLRIFKRECKKYCLHYVGI